ncbi:hypothetical protein COO60DRAFT_1546877 [Scenedesmus sp. NREL 46B-D3]|nr:hypothetical protein COO60DRAFT_1546877 [Scenedesmus sp. NREL 46B-D3]
MYGLCLHCLGQVALAACKRRLQQLWRRLLSPQEVRWQWRCTSGSVIIAHINAKLLQHMHSAAWCSGLYEDTAPELWLTWAPHVGAVTNQYRVFSTQHIHICWCALSCSGRRLSNASFEDGGCVHQNGAGRLSALAPQQLAVGMAWSQQLGQHHVTQSRVQGRAFIRFSRPS